MPKCGHRYAQRIYQCSRDQARPIGSGRFRPLPGIDHGRPRAATTHTGSDPFQSENGSGSIRQSVPLIPGDQWSVMSRATTSTYNTHPRRYKSPTHSIEPTQFRSSKSPPPESGCGLMVPSRAIRQDHMERVKLSSVVYGSRRIRICDLIAEEQPHGARKMRRYVYNRRLESGKDVISHQTHRSWLPKRPVTMQTHDPQEDDRYKQSTTP